jgi:hypothetical protein
MNELHKRDAAAWTMGASAALVGALVGAGAV